MTRRVVARLQKSALAAALRTSPLGSAALRGREACVVRARKTGKGDKQRCREDELLREGDADAALRTVHRVQYGTDDNAKCQPGLCSGARRCAMQRFRCGFALCDHAIRSVSWVESAPFVQHRL